MEQNAFSQFGFLVTNLSCAPISSEIKAAAAYSIEANSSENTIFDNNNHYYRRWRRWFDDDDDALSNKLNNIFAKAQNRDGKLAAGKVYSNKFASLTANAVHAFNFVRGFSGDTFAHNRLTPDGKLLFSSGRESFWCHQVFVFTRCKKWNKLPIKCRSWKHHRKHVMASRAPGEKHID